MVMVMVMATTLTLNLSLSLYHNRPNTPLLHSSTLTSSFPINSKPLSFSHPKFDLHLQASPSPPPPPPPPPNPYNFDDDEIRWLREEQRWIREEQRWLREESRWRSERESLLREISNLKLNIQALDRQKSLQGASMNDTIANVTAMLQVLKDVESGSNVGRIAESGSSASPMVLETTDIGMEEEKAAVVVKDIRVVEREQGEGKKVTRKALKMGSEGEEVQLMQEALLRLGFYSGEEDMEYSSFSSGTESAVKTWQATLGASEDGIMTADLLERLYTDQLVEGVKTVNEDLKNNDATVPTKGANGAAVASITEISESHHTVVKEKGVTEVDVTQHRVFLLGENRWEDPSRLVGRDSQVGRSETSNATPKCPSCHGEGLVLCIECDGSGEPNIEEQFMEWVDEGAKCPYCEGGYAICDVCEGKTMT